MKILNSFVGWIVILALGFLVFVYFFQKQQNEHQERMVTSTASLVQIKHNTENQLVQRNEQKTFGQKLTGAIRTLITHAINIFS